VLSRRYSWCTLTTHKEHTMQDTLRALTAQIAKMARSNADAYLPMSPLSGLGQAGELAAQHPAFADAPEWDARRTA
jgi:hypothetical protein